MNYGAITRKSVISWEKTGPNVRPFGPGRERRTFLRRRAVPTRRDPECHRRRLPHSSCTPVPANDRRYRKMRRFLLLNQSPGFLKMHKRRRKRPRLRVRRAVAIFAVAIASKVLWPPIESNATLLLRAYGQRRAIRCDVPIFLQARLDHLLGCITPGLRIGFHVARGKPSIKACVGVACAITFRNRYRARDP